jgi:hypothetical protein
MTTKVKPGFQKGKSGNPAGRTKGSKNRATLLAIAAMEGELDAIVRSIIDAAKGGDMSAARLVVDKLIPAAKDRPIGISLPDLKELDGCREATATVIQSVADGDLLPGDGERLTAMIEFQRKGLEGAEIMRRLDAIEERLNMKEGI